MALGLAETWEFLKKGAAYYQDDSYFHSLKGAEDIQKGEPAIGYRVMYKANDKYFSPLIDDSITRNTKSMKVWADKAVTPGQGSIWLNQGVSHSDYEIRPANVEDGASIGYYYFPDKEQATEYMAAIAAGAKKTFNNSSLIDDKYGLGEGVELGLFRVRGTAGSKPWDEGAVMNDMTIDPEPLLSVDTQTVKQLYGVLEAQNKELGAGEEFFNNYGNDLDRIIMLRRMDVLTEEQREALSKRQDAEKKV